MVVEWIPGLSRFSQTLYITTDGDEVPMHRYTVA